MFKVGIVELLIVSLICLFPVLLSLILMAVIVFVRKTNKPKEVLEEEINQENPIDL